MYLSGVCRELILKGYDSEVWTQGFFKGVVSGRCGTVEVWQVFSFFLTR